MSKVSFAAAAGMAEEWIVADYTETGLKRSCRKDLSFAVDRVAADFGNSVVALGSCAGRLGSSVAEFAVEFAMGSTSAARVSAYAAALPKDSELAAGLAAVVAAAAAAVVV